MQVWRQADRQTGSLSLKVVLFFGCFKLDAMEMRVGTCHGVEGVLGGVDSLPEIWRRQSASMRFELGACHSGELPSHLKLHPSTPPLLQK